MMNEQVTSEVDVEAPVEENVPETEADAEAGWAPVLEDDLMESEEPEFEE
jgi:hypothetical protein